jgi:hypothetical protein
MNLPDWCYGVPWLTVRQPWADLLMAGVKDVENRSRPPASTLPQWGRCDCGERVDADDLANGFHVEPDHAPGCWGECGSDCPVPVRCGPVVPDGPFPFRLGIHAAAKVQWPDLDKPEWAAWDALNLWDNDQPGFGVLLGSVQVNGCHHAHECQEWDDDDLDDAAIYCSRWADLDGYHWTLSGPEPLPEPIPWKGRLGLWRIDREAAA